MTTEIDFGYSYSKGVEFENGFVEGHNACLGSNYVKQAIIKGKIEMLEECNAPHCTTDEGYEKIQKMLFKLCAELKQLETPKI